MFSFLKNFFSYSIVFVGLNNTIFTATIYRFLEEFDFGRLYGMFCGKKMKYFRCIIMKILFSEFPSYKKNLFWKYHNIRITIWEWELTLNNWDINCCIINSKEDKTGWNPEWNMRAFIYVTSETTRPILMKFKIHIY